MSSDTSSPWLSKWEPSSRLRDYATTRLEIVRLLIEQQIRIDSKRETKRLSARTAQDVKQLIKFSRHLVRQYCKGE